MSVARITVQVDSLTIDIKTGSVADKDMSEWGTYFGGCIDVALARLTNVKGEALKKAVSELGEAISELGDARDEVNSLKDQLTKVKSKNKLKPSKARDASVA